MECANIYYDKQHYFPMHLHPDLYTFSYILGGSANLILKDSIMRLKENDLVIIPPYMAHQTLIENYFYYKVIRVPKSYSFIDISSNQSGLILMNNCFSYKDHFNNWFTSIKTKSKNLQSKVNENTEIPDVFKRFLINDTFKSSNQKPTTILKKALTHFENNFGSPILLEELCDITHVSTSHFQRLFKNNVGISPMRYLLNLRIEKAKGYIKIKDNFTDIAYDTGFYDQSHFNKYFKINVGMIPKRYADFIHND